MPASTVNKVEKVTVEKDPFNDYWNLTIVGVVQGIEKKNIDKSGRNPKHNVHLMISATNVERPDGDITLPEVFKVRTNDAGFASLGPVAAGDQVEVTASCIGRAPSLFHLNTFKKL